MIEKIHICPEAIHLKFFGGAWGKWLGYSSEPCPNCGRIRLERYENGKEVCEICKYCPQEDRYVSDDEIYPPEEE